MNSPLPYRGGKSLLAKRIVEMMPEHDSYGEVFAGAGWVFFRKPRSKYESINDINGDLVSFYRVLQCHLEEFLKQFKWLLSSREIWEDWGKQMQAGGLTDIQRAARFYYRQRLSFGGKVVGQSFGQSVMHAPRINLLRIEEELSAVHLRLAGATIERLPWDAYLERYDRPQTLLYLDPPYWGCEADYGKGVFCREDFPRMADILKTLQGRFILSINDVPEIREIFGGFTVTPMQTSYSSRKEDRAASELLVMNL
jgi:DNA adenine methylase